MLWLGSGIFSVVCALIYAAGRYLLRPVPSVTTAAGPGRRRAISSTFFNTACGVVLGACVGGIYAPGDASAKAGGAVAGFLVIYLGIHAVVCCHELGHFIAAALLGMEIQHLQVGTGPLLCAVTPGGVRCEWRALHGGGQVLACCRDERLWRLRHALFVVGGPVAHAAVCAALAWGAWLLSGRAVHLPGGWPGTAVMLMLLLLLPTIQTWFCSVVPAFAPARDGRRHNDARSLWRLPSLSQAAVRQTIVVLAVRAVEQRWQQGRQEAARQRLRQVQARYPEHLGLAIMEGQLLAWAGRHAEAAVCFQQQLAATGLSSAGRAQLAGSCFLEWVQAGDPAAARRFGTDFLRATAPEARADVLDALATNALTAGLRAFLPEVDAWSQELLSLDPAKITCCGTRGAALVELDRIDEGEAMLRNVWNTSPGEMDAAISAFYLGVAARNRGRTREMRHWRKRALDFRAVLAKPFVERIETELAIAPPT